jgi:DNA-binding transcriptional ArsR family regulator
MHEDTGLGRVAQLLADPARASILWMLIDGTSRPAGELAHAARISAQSASGHLAKLVAGGLLQSEPQGRHRYFRLASPEVAGVLEALTSLASAAKPRAARSVLPAPSVPVAFLHARTCYGHLAGEMAVKVLQAMLKERWLAAAGRDYSLSRLGEERLTALGVDLERVRQRRAVFARPCVDLTQRRPHLAGGLGDALLDLYVERGWVRRARGSRAVGITPQGDAGFKRYFAISSL